MRLSRRVPKYPSVMPEKRITPQSLLRSLPASQRRALTTKSDRAGLIHLATHVAAIGLASTWILLRWPFWPLAIVVQGVLLVFLFTLLHECIHRTAFSSRWLNDTVAAACSVVLILPREWFRHFHLSHHRYTQDPERDPELSTPRPRTRRELFIYLSGLPLFVSALRTVTRNAVGRHHDAFVPLTSRQQVRTEARLMMGLLGAAALFAVFGPDPLGQDPVIMLWVLPILCGQPFLRLYLLAEHGGCPFVNDVFANTRTTFTTAALRRLAWNMPFHAEHHAVPAVPFHKLPELHTLTREHLRVTSNGYLEFSRKHVRTLPG